jgi:adenosylmethionine-8-amino-7-oxononanoate aminotransferase
MRICGLIGILLALSGCASEREIAFIYYPTRPAGDVFPPPSEFASEAQKECSKYGLVAVHDWDSVTSFQRVRSYWRCVPA